MNIIKAWTSTFPVLCHIPFLFTLLHIPVCLNDMGIIALELRFLHMPSSRACEGLKIISSNLWTCNRHLLAYLHAWLDHCHLLLMQPHFFLHIFYSCYWLFLRLLVLIFLLWHFSMGRVSSSWDFWRLNQCILNHYHLLKTDHYHWFCYRCLHLYYYHFHYYCFLTRSHLIKGGCFGIGLHKTATRTGICDFTSSFQIHILRWGQKSQLYNHEH